MQRDYSPPERKSVLQRASKVFRVILVVLLLVVFPLVVLLAVFEAQDRQWVTCEVLEAESSQGNRFNSADWIVAIETSDCGRITYIEGVTEGNVEDIAASFDSGEYEFKLGLASRLAADDWIPVLQPSAVDYRSTQ